MRIGIYARVSTEAQEAKGTVASQLAALRERALAEGDEVIEEFCDDGYSGARLDRPALDALRDAAAAGAIEGLWCLSPDRLARVYALQVVILDELARRGVLVRFVDTPDLDDPQARLLTQIQGVVSEYERAKIAERNRRGKLYRARVGEVLGWKVPYGYRRVPRTAERGPHLVIHEQEAAVVASAFEDYVSGRYSIRQLTKALGQSGHPSPSGQSHWNQPTVSRMLRNEAYVGRFLVNRTMQVPDAARPGVTRQAPRPREEWVTIACPAIVSEDLFEAAGRVSRDNSNWSPRRSEPGTWLLRRLVSCGTCHVHLVAHRARRRAGGFIRYYSCPNHDALRAAGAGGYCPEHRVRADELDAFVFEQVHAALLEPSVLAAGEAALVSRSPAHDDELLDAQLARLERRGETANGERRRLADLYQAGLLELEELTRRATELDARRRRLETERIALLEQREALLKHNELRRRIAGFADRVAAALPQLDFEQRQQLLRTVVEDVAVQGWQVEIRLRMPIDDPAGSRPKARSRGRARAPVSSDDVLRSIGLHLRPLRALVARGRQAGGCQARGLAVRCAPAITSKASSWRAGAGTEADPLWMRCART